MQGTLQSHAFPLLLIVINLSLMAFSALGMPEDDDALTEQSAASWGAAAEHAIAYITDDPSHVQVGSASVRFETKGGFDTWMWTPVERNAGWNLESDKVRGIGFWVYAENKNIGFQNLSPWVRLFTSENDYFEYHPTKEALNDAHNKWIEFIVPFDGSPLWKRIIVGNPNLAEINWIEIHADTWEFGFKLWIDGFRFLPFEITELRLPLESLVLLENWRWVNNHLLVTVDGTQTEISASQAIWTSSDPSVASVNEEGHIFTHNEGLTTITAILSELEVSVDVTVKSAVLDPVYEEIDPYLAEPAPGHIYEVPVVVIRYLPTTDGVNLDVAKAPDFWWLNPISLADMKRNIDTFDKRVKFMLEEGSKFRGYKNLQAVPSLGYRVVEYITVHEHTPPGKIVGQSNGHPTYLPDFHQIFERFNIEHYINDMDVKEIWFWQTHFDAGQPSYDPGIHDPIDFRGLWESNMSSPTTEDISNSDRDNSDLPVYESTYTVYGQNIRRTQSEVVHNHGHQLEAILSHANWLQDGNTDLFWKKFVGQDEGGNFIRGRAGWTHMPPNTIEHYDYMNSAFFETDIEDWTPEGTGAKTIVNVDTWGNLPYAWPDGETDFGQRVEAQWYIYWMQNMPGHGNTIRHGDNYMTNWWTFAADWDAAMSSKMGLYGTKAVGEFQ